MSDIKLLDIPCVTGKNIDLCCIRTDDEAIRMYAKWMNDESINMWIHHNQWIDQYLQEEEWAKSYKPRQNKFLIVEKETRKPIGSCSIDYNDGITASLGICIGEECGRNKGYGTETMKLMIRFAFMQLNAHRVSLKVVAGNGRARRCYEKAGFRICGTLHESIYYNGGYDDMFQMELLRSDWNEENE